MRLGLKDQRVLAAFVDRKPLDGHKLSTNGERVDGHWLGGARIAEWVDGQRGEQIVFNDLGSRSAQSVQRAIRHHAAPYQLAEFDPTRRKRGSRAVTYLHYGSATHHPMQTVRFEGNASELRRVIREAKSEGTPLRVQKVEE